MASLIAAAPLAGLPVTVGAARLSAVGPGPVTSIAPFRGQEAAVARALGAAIPLPGRVERMDGARLMWTGPGRVLLVGQAPPEGLERLAAVVDLSDAQAWVVLDGAAARDVLARLVPVDLRDGAFPDGATARTLVNHMTATVSRVGSRVGADAYEVAAMRSMAGTLVHEIVAAMRHVAARGARAG